MNKKIKKAYLRGAFFYLHLVRAVQPLPGLLVRYEVRGLRAGGHQVVRVDGAGADQVSNRGACL